MNDGRFVVALGPLIAKVIYSGLKRLELFLSDVLQQIDDLDIDLSDIRESLIQVNSIIMKQIINHYMKID